MALFLAMGGSGVGGGAVLTLTYSSEFYGETITATDGTKTVTKVAPSTGTMDITLPESGTWVVSATIDGQTYSTTVTVDLEYTATLEAIPDGSTVTPTDNIQTWLRCAGITDKTTYTTLSDVLGDTETLIALCADSNACDYMARSTNWASGVAADSTAMLIVGKYNYCANKLLSNSTWASAICNSTYFESVLNVKVPIMTSNTTPSGECFANSETRAAYNAFDGSTSSSWQSNSATPYIGYKFPQPVTIYKVETWNGQYGQGDSCEVQSSTDGTNYTKIADIADLGSYKQDVVTNVTNPTEGQYCRLYFNGLSLKDMQLIQFYGRTDNANYIPLVPKMTSNTTPSGECSASSIYGSGYDAYKAFTGNINDEWAASSSSTPAYIQYKFTEAVCISGFSFRQGTSGGHTKISTFKIQGSNTGNSDDWTDLYSGTAPDDTTQKDISGYFSDATNYLYCRMYITGLHTNTTVSLSALQFYRKATLPIIHSAVEDNIFYMDDGSPVALCGIPVGDTIDVDMEAFKGQTLTLVSTVAKDPDNLSNDFSMNVRITPNITEIYLMPYGALYWWGYNNGVEAGTSANGWTGSHMGGSVTFNKDSASIIAGSGQETGLTTHDAITAFDKLHCIVNTSYNTTIFLMYGSKNYAGSVLVQKTLSTGLTHDELTITSKTGYPMIYEYNKKTITGYAMWVE